jgi:hypothetical protein
MQGANKREETPRGFDIDGEAFFERALQHFAGFVVQPAPAHIDRLDLTR